MNRRLVHISLLILQGAIITIALGLQVARILEGIVPLAIIAGVSALCVVLHNILDRERRV